MSPPPKQPHMSDFLFSIDFDTEEVIISESPKGSNQITFIEGIPRKDNEVLFNSVVTLTSITQSSPLDTNIFKSMDKVCQMIYTKHKESHSDG